MIDTDSASRLPNAPINEMSFTVTTDEPIVDAFTISGLHERFRDAYPNVERQPPVAALDVAPIIGLPPMITGEDRGVPPRWWFTSPAGDSLIQAQERMVAWNWRRLAIAEPATYEGFEAYSSRARVVFEEIRRFGEQQGLGAARPTGAQLTYDNLIPLLDKSGSKRRLEDIVTTWKSLNPPRNTAGFQFGWMEPAVEGSESLSSILTVTAVIAATLLPNTLEPTPFLKLTLTTSNSQMTWDGLWQYFHDSHALITERFKQLVTEQLQSEFMH